MIQTARKATPYTDEQFSEIEKALGGKLRLSENQKEMLNQGKWFMEAKIHFLPKRNPPPGQINESERKQIEAIRQKTADLIEILETSGYLLEYPLSLGKNIDDLHMIMSHAVSVQKRIGEPTGKVFSRPKGRTPEIDRDAFIHNLRNSYKIITGKEARPPYKDIYDDKKNRYKGPFFRFTEACVNPIALQTNASLGKAIIKVMKQPPVPLP
jgi:hypothetical protein